ncbi:cytochrome P450 4V2-like [Centruroides vittatus]|uniref:cytochrome P450 4V2-like n=1 Tax=Centruroides vittatus TaxID=120091 RepID=UPI00351031B0
MEIKENETLKNNNKFQVISTAELLYRHLINNKISLKYFIDELLMSIVASYHTTSMTLCWCLHEMGRNKKVLSRVQEEIDSVFYNDIQRPISKEDLNKMTYLECVIKETMRLYPVTPNTARKSTQDLKFGGIKYSKGTSFIIPIFHLHRNPIYFPNPNVFDPDRFLQENSNINSSAYIPFSAGIRMCIGKNF